MCAFKITRGLLMRVENWRAKGIFDQIASNALEAANEIMDDHAKAAKLMCPVGTVNRPDGYVNRPVVFTPSTGKGKGKEVRFVARTWMGRKPGSLRDTIRKVTKPSRPGNIRVYAGTNKVFYARFVEYGTVKTPRQSFMRPTFQAIKGTIESRIEAGIRKSPEVK